jgi:nitroreductase
MNEIIDHINNHRTIRKFLSKEISKEIEEAILECATRGSTSGNLQSYCMIVSRQSENIVQLMALHENQSVVREAALLITFCVDWNRFNKWCEYRNEVPNYDTMWALFVGTGDAFIAAQNCALAAESLGLGICYLGSTLMNAFYIGEFLKCPKGVVPVTTLAIGWPTDIANKKLRLPLHGILHEEKYHDYDETTINSIYQEKETRDWERLSLVPELKKSYESLGVTNIPATYTKARHTRERVTIFTNNLVKAIRRAGFNLVDELPKE